MSAAQMKLAEQGDGVAVDLAWGPWNDTPPYRSWDGTLEMRRAPTSFGDYLLLRRHGFGAGCRHIHVGKWFVGRPGAGLLGPFGDDVTAARAAQQDVERRTQSLLKKRDPRAETAKTCRFCGHVEGYCGQC